MGNANSQHGERDSAQRGCERKRFFVILTIIALALTSLVAQAWVISVHRLEKDSYELFDLLGDSFKIVSSAQEAVKRHDSSLPFQAVHFLGFSVDWHGENSDDDAKDATHERDSARTHVSIHSYRDCLFPNNEAELTSQGGHNLVILMLDRCAPTLTNDFNPLTPLAQAFDNLYHEVDVLSAKIISARENLCPSLLQSASEGPTCVVAMHIKGGGKRIGDSGSGSGRRSHPYEKELLEVRSYLIERHLSGRLGALVFEDEGREEREEMENIKSFFDITVSKISTQILEQRKYEAFNGKEPNEDEQVVHLEKLCGAVIRSRKYEPLCMPPSADLRPLLVTGLGGAGTHNITR